MEKRTLYHSKFLKNFKRRISPKPRLVQEFKEALQIFLENPSNPTLKDHQLSKADADKRAFSVTEDIRVVYRKINNGILLYDIGTHDQVY